MMLSAAACSSAICSRRRSSRCWRRRSASAGDSCSAARSRAFSSASFSSLARFSRSFAARIDWRSRSEMPASPEPALADGVFFFFATAATVGSGVRTKSSSVAASARLTKRSSDGKSCSPPKPRSSRGAGAPLRGGTASGSRSSSETLAPKWRASPSSSVSPTSSPRPHVTLTCAASVSPKVTTSSVRCFAASCSRTGDSFAIRVSTHARRPAHHSCSCFCVVTWRTVGCARGLTHAVTEYAEATCVPASCFGFLPPDAKRSSGCVWRVSPNFSIKLLFEGSFASQSSVPVRTRPRRGPRLSLKTGCTRYGRGRCCPSYGSPL